jgi:hypothetical protein
MFEPFASRYTTWIVAAACPPVEVSPTVAAVLGNVIAAESAEAAVFVSPDTRYTDELATEYVPEIAVALTVIVLVKDAVDEKFDAEVASYSVITIEPAVGVEIVNESEALTTAERPLAAMTAPETAEVIVPPETVT